MAKATVRLKPFTVPNYVSASSERESSPADRVMGHSDAPKFHLCDLDAQTLSDLCDEFRASVFAKAAKADPHKPDRHS